MRVFAVLLGLLLVTYAGVVEAMTSEIHSDPELERSLCKWLLLCSTEVVVEDAEAYLVSVEPQAEQAAIAGYREALQRSPADASRWADLGEALTLSGAFEDAAYCFEQALRFAPHSPPTLFRTASFYDEAQRLEESHATFRHLLELTRTYDDTVFAYLDSTGQPAGEVFRSAIPDQSEALVSYFRHELSSGDADHLSAVWEVLNERNLVDSALLSAYVDRLVVEERLDEAVSVRSSFLDDTWSSDSPNPNALFNGGFDEDFIETPLDWKIRPHDGVQIERVENQSDEDFALRIRFGGSENIAFRNVSQDFVVAPGSYYCSAWLRSEALTTDQGVSLRIYDPADPRQDLRSEPISGTTNWTEVTFDFSVAEGSLLLRIEVFRNPSHMFDNKISGSVWLDDVECLVDG